MKCYHNDVHFISFFRYFEKWLLLVEAEVVVLEEDEKVDLEGAGVDLGEDREEVEVSLCTLSTVIIYSELRLCLFLGIVKFQFKIHVK